MTTRLQKIKHMQDRRLRDKTQHANIQLNHRSDPQVFTLFNLYPQRLFRQNKWPEANRVTHAGHLTLCDSTVVHFQIRELARLLSVFPIAFDLGQQFVHLLCIGGRKQAVSASFKHALRCPAPKGTDSLTKSSPKSKVRRQKATALAVCGERKSTTWYTPSSWFPQALLPLWLRQPQLQDSLRRYPSRWHILGRVAPDSPAGVPTGHLLLKHAAQVWDKSL